MVSIEAAGLPIATIRTRNTDAPELYITHIDHLRSTRLVTTEGAGLGNVNIVEETDYDPFGKITRHEQTGDFAEKKKFTSHEFDSATNYTYAKARYLETNAGRFISQDKAFLELGSPQLSESFEKSAFAGQYIANRLRGVDDTRAALETILKDPQALNSYAYVRNNPVKFVDETGELFLLDDAAGFLVGGLAGVGVQITASVLTGQTPTLGELGGAFMSGGIVGVGIVNIPATGGLSAIGAAALVGGTGGFLGNITKQAIDVSTGVQDSFSGKELGISTGVGIVLGGVTEGILPSARIPGLSSGRGNMNAVGKAMQTKLTNGTIGSMSASTAFKSAIGSQAADAYKAVADLLFQIGQTLNGLQGSQSR